tara:strand:+ start:2090 stop:3256 length:1167 start_codon:yes stop_codon:yes gene_type:complete
MFREKNGPGINKKGRDPLYPVRVIEVIDDDTHYLYDVLDMTPEDIGTILYRPVDSSAQDLSEEGDKVFTGKAYPLNPNINTLPLKNEVVLLVEGPRRNLRASANDAAEYYISIVNILSHPHVNAYPVFDEPGAPVNIGEGIELRDDVAPLQPFPGDTLIEGRLGQSIRLSGGASQKNPFTDDSNKNKPFTFIRNGVTIPEGGNGFTHILENIDKDPASIYLTSDHTIPLTLGNTKRKSYDNIPDLPSDYKGQQILLNAGRLTFNAKKDDILLSSVNSVGINSKTVNLDGDEFICLDADKIFLGSKAREISNIGKQPVMLGHEVERYLKEMLAILDSICTGMQAASNGGGSVPSVNAAGNSAKVRFRELALQINPEGTSKLKSTKTFVE